jgi:hypothetical protein
MGLAALYAWRFVLEESKEIMQCAAMVWLTGSLFLMPVLRRPVEPAPQKT